MADVHANGIRFNAQILEPQEHTADAPTVVFVHGLISDNLSSFYYTLAGPAVVNGARVILYDLRGHGRSHRPETGYTADDGVNDLCALLDALGVDEPVHLVANSYGGIVAARMAVTEPDRVAGLTLIEASCAGTSAAAWIEDMANTLSVTALRLEYDGARNQYDKAGQRRMARLIAHADGLLNRTTLVDDVASERPLRPAELAAIRCPVLGVYGERSELVGAAAELARHVPDCTVEILPGLAHTVLREATEILRDILLTWLAEQRTRARERRVPAAPLTKEGP
ncbi:alpha/beta fold hydrolase [Actinomadura xylanilytica]|uniref:alpha/beta fold hydrolase n=1 Tax=Actinomadura xylanilytica TaxID=887459 RepID=UPI00255B2AFE|nr:alpha/beta hydrolase [Actinomadura xylanilytica]MDL4774234.1 alpha/beta hydrolase [Actinomadura xylanilytica]